MSQQLWSGKTKGNVLGYRIFIWCLRIVGLRAAYHLLRVVALYYFFTSRTSNKVLRSFLRDRIGWTKAKSFWYTYKNYFVFGQTLLDKMALMIGIKTPHKFTFDGEEYLRQMVQDGKGGILISGHIGNWEAAGQLLKRINAKGINIVMMDAEHQKIKGLIENSIGDRNFNIIGIKDDMSHVFKIANAAMNGEIICIHGDRFAEGQPTRERNFLGSEAKFPFGPFQIASKLGVPYSVVFAVKKENFSYGLSATPLKHSKNPDEILDTFVEAFEQKVKENPLQWFNYYPFWNN